MSIRQMIADGYDLHGALYATLEQNEQAVAEMREQAVKKARASKNFQVQLARSMVRLRTSGNAPASVLKDLAKGEAEVAAALFDSELQECLWDACKEEVMLRKREVDVLREEIAREHAEAGRGF